MTRFNDIKLIVNFALLKNQIALVEWFYLKTGGNGLDLFIEQMIEEKGFF